MPSEHWGASRKSPHFPNKAHRCFVGCLPRRCDFSDAPGFGSPHFPIRPDSAALPDFRE
ncbi:TPA: hypothetical protein ACFP4U_000695 [Neisseria lactamica]